MSQSKIGTDEWVRQYQKRRGKPAGMAGVVQRVWLLLPTWAWLALLVAAGLLFPLTTDNTYIIRVGGTIALMATLGLGLNVVVGYAGLLDLGYVAFYGIGGYAYAYLSSEFTTVHWPTWLSLIVITVLAALFGLLLGSPSLRLIGDYLAIVTLGFGQIFVQLTTSLTRVNLPGIEKPLNLTGGPNGIVNLDPVHLFGFSAQSVKDYYYVLFIVLIVVLVVVYHLNYSRIGRAWRALREDELAAETMGMPTRRLKLMAFAIGAAIAGLSGALFAAWQGAVFPSNFDITLLITLYAIIVLGGLGSLPGVLIASVIMIAVPELLRDVRFAGLLFYAGAVLTLYATLKPRWQILPLLALLALFGLIVTFLVMAATPGASALLSPPGSPVGIWIPLPANSSDAGNLAFFASIVMVLFVTRVKKHRWRFIALIPTLYLLAFAWETRMSQEPSITRLMFVGVLLVVLMIYRPNGLLGQRRVEVV